MGEEREMWLWWWECGRDTREVGGKTWRWRLFDKSGNVQRLPTTKRVSNWEFIFSLTLFWRAAVESWGLCVYLGYDLLGKSMWHLSCFCKCYLGAWLWGSDKSQVGGLVLAQVLTNTEFPFLDSPVVLQWPDEAVHKTKCEVAENTSKKI